MAVHTCGGSAARSGSLELRATRDEQKEIF